MTQQSIPSVVIQLYNQIQLNQFDRPVLSSYAQDMLHYTLGHFETRVHNARHVIVSDEHSGYHGNDDQRLGLLLVDHFTEWYPGLPKSNYLLDVVTWLASHAPDWQPCYEAMERHAAIGLEEGHPDHAATLYVSPILVFEFIMYDPNSALTSICAQHYFAGDDSDTQPSESSYYLSKAMYLHHVTEDTFLLGGAINAAILDNNPTQAATVIMSEVTKLLDGIGDTSIEMADEIHRQLAAMLMDNTPALSNTQLSNVHPHRNGNDNADEVIDLSKL